MAVETVKKISMFASHNACFTRTFGKQKKMLALRN